MKVNPSRNKRVFPLLPLLILGFLPACQEEKDITIADPCFSIQILEGNEQIGIPEKRLTTPLLIQVKDDMGKPIVLTDIEWTVVSGGGTLSPISKTDANGLSMAYWTLGTTGVQTVRAKILKENILGCTNPLSVDFTASLGTIEIKKISYNVSETPDCDANVGILGYTYDMDIEYATTFDLSKYNLGVLKTYQTDKAPGISSSETKPVSQSPTNLKDKSCIVWGIWEWIDATYSIILVDKFTNERLYYSNTETVRLERKTAPIGEIPEIQIIKTKTELTEINSQTCAKSNNGSTIDAEIELSSSVPLNNFYIEMVTYFKFDNQQQESIFESAPNSLENSKAYKQFCTRFGSTNAIEFSYLIRIYEKGQDGKKMGEVLSASNRSEVNRVVKPAGANRLKFDSDEGPGIISISDKK